MGNSCGRLEAHSTGQTTTRSLASSTDGLARLFLEGIGLDVYAVAFKVVGYDTQQQLSCLTEQDLDKIQWQSHTPILPAHRQRILEASRFHPALQVGLPTTQQGTAAAAVCSAIMEDDNEGEQPEAAAATVSDTQTTAAAAATAEQAGSVELSSSTTASTAAGCAVSARQEHHAGQAVKGAATELVASGQELEHAQQVAIDGAAACSGGVAVPQQHVQADGAPHEDDAAADSCKNGAAAGDAAAEAPAAVSTEAPTAEARATVARLLQKLQLACVPWKTSQSAASQEPAASTAAGTPSTALGQTAAGDAQQQLERHEGQSSVRPAVSAGAPAAAENANEPQPSSEMQDASGAAAAAAAAAAGTPREAGPLMANKTALLHSRVLSANVQRKSAPTAWTQLPHAVASQVYATKPPRPVQPPVHVAPAHQEAHADAGSGTGQLQGEASSTAVTAAAALQAQRSLLAAAAALAEPAAARQQAGGSLAKHQQQLAHGSASDTEYKPQEQWWLQYAPSTQVSAADGTAPAAVAAAANDVPALCASVSPVSKSSSSRASSRQRGPAAAESLECSSVITGSVVVGALPGNALAAAGCSGHYPASTAVELTAGGNLQQQHAAVPPAPYNLWSPSELLPSPKRLLQQADRQQLTASLVKQLSNTHSSSGRAGTAAGAYQGASHRQTTRARYGAAQEAHVSSAGAHLLRAATAAGTAECRYSGGYSRAGGNVPEQSLRQRCSATAVLPAAASAEQAGASELAQRLGPHHSQLTVDLSRVSVMSGSSMAGDRPSSSRPGSRASDVCSIVIKAKERSAARQRLPGGTATPLASSSSSLTLLSPRQLQQQLTTASLNAAMAGGHGDAFSCSSRGAGQEGQGVAARAETCGVAGGEQAMRMLQDYRTMAELDAAIKARVSQLSSSSNADKPGMDSAAAGRYGSAAGLRLPDDAVGVRGTTAASKAAADSWGRAAAVASPEADTANRSDCSPDRQQRQQQHRGRPGPADTRAVVDGTVAIGLLGICEALDNSYDAGRPSAAAAATGRTSAGGYSSSSWGGRRAYGKQAQPDAGYRNPFLSPSPTESPTPDVSGGAGAGRDAGRGHAQHKSDVDTTASAWAGDPSSAGYGGGKAWGGSAGMALAGRGAHAAAAEAAVDERIRRIVQASRTHAAAAE